MSGRRLDSGGRIDRNRPLSFTFDGRRYSGFHGDTLASALMANGARLMGRSFKYHRPRGLMTIGADEPNALVTIRRDGFCEPNTRATMVELYDGLVAESQNRWPSLGFDLWAANDALSRFIPAGFYYKTFMGPTRKAWMLYEHYIRKAAGLGRASRDPDPSHYDKMNAHADVAVVGGGLYGLQAALAAAETGERVTLIDDAAELGGWLLRERDAAIGGLIAKLRGMDNVTVLSRTTAFGLYDGFQIAAAERVQDHLPEFDAHTPRQRLWLIRAKRIVLACGAFEQPLQFQGNDRPGVMLAGAARGYLNQYGVAPGKTAVIVTNNDDAYQTAFDFQAAGVQVVAIVDTRAEPGAAAQRARNEGIGVMTATPRRAVYGGRLRLFEVFEDGRIRTLPCDLIAMSGGFAPAIHLSTHLGGKPAYDGERGFFLPPPLPAGITCAGAMTGETLAKTHMPDNPPIKSFVDIQGDVTVKDVQLAHREGYRSVEHLKRYTTLGMGTEQGKTSNIAGLTVMAGLMGRSIADTGCTTFRAPYTPVSIGALGGLDVGEHLRPLRRTPMQTWHEQNGGYIVETGVWRRPKAYLRGDGDTVGTAQVREARAVRSGVGCVDVSTLGKIEVQGPDAAEFLDRIYCSPVKTLKIGRARYGLMLREDGIVMDDGTLARLSANHYYISTTTAQAANVLYHMEYHAQVTWPQMRVSIISVSDQYGAIAVAGPQSKTLLAGLSSAQAFDDAGFPYPALKVIEFGGVPVRVLRASYSGERAYELHVPADYALSLWEMLIAAGAAPYGTEAMAILRIEKGHIAGAELDGRTTAADFGLGKMASKASDFIGKRMLGRHGLNGADRPALAGLVPVDGQSRIRSGSQITAERDLRPPMPMLGYVTSVAYSPVLESPIALAMVSGAADRMGEVVYAHFPLRNEVTAVKIVPPVFYDPEGARMHV
jgi:sarcosine oxidase subunit alpha